jgi:preprotein translocase subunit SecE
MARDRQRQKQRQQQRREERLAQRRESGTSRAEPAGAQKNARDDGVGTPDEVRDPDALELADLEVGAPLEDIGRSDRTLRDEPPAPSFDTDDETLADDDGSSTAPGPRGHRGASEGAAPQKRGRLLAFLVAVWAELQRVQWPDRKTLTQLTGVVLFFVLIVGAYLGALDAIISKLIQQIL